VFAEYRVFFADGITIREDIVVGGYVDCLAAHGVIFGPVCCVSFI
jgi:hypothetical protein